MTSNHNAIESRAPFMRPTTKRGSPSSRSLSRISSPRFGSAIRDNQQTPCQRVRHDFVVSGAVAAATSPRHARFEFSRRRGALCPPPDLDALVHRPQHLALDGRRLPAGWSRRHVECPDVVCAACNGAMKRDEPIRRDGESLFSRTTGAGVLAGISPYVVTSAEPVIVAGLIVGTTPTDKRLHRVAELVGVDGLLEVGVEAFAKLHLAVRERCQRQRRHAVREWSPAASMAMRRGDRRPSPQGFGLPRRLLRAHRRRGELEGTWTSAGRSSRGWRVTPAGRTIVREARSSAGSGPPVGLVPYSMTGSVEAERAVLHVNVVLHLSIDDRLVAAVAGARGARSG